MRERIAYAKVTPAAMAAMLGLDEYVGQSDLEPALLDLVRTRASQINGCAYCVDMHTKDARARGETEQRLYALPVWRETPFFTERERAALAWSEAVTLLPRCGVTDELYEEARAALQRDTTGEPDDGGDRHQRVESAVSCVPHGAGDLSPKHSREELAAGV